MHIRDCLDIKASLEDKNIEGQMSFDFTDIDKEQ